jgi:rhodanese-related sulfurtransferase
MNKMTSDASLSELMNSGLEYTVIDVRDEGTFARGHLIQASSVPLRRLEVGLASHHDLRRHKIVLCDEDGQSDAMVAAQRMADWGFVDVSVLESGIAGWQSAGRPIYAGMHTMSKAFGEAVEVAMATPSITPDELVRRSAAGEPVFVIDCRPHAEYAKSSLPGSVNVPGFELPYRWSHVVPNPTVPVVVHCAGRTRSIIGAQTLIEIGVPNPVVALENGTMGWLRAGYELVPPNRQPAGFDADFRPREDAIQIANAIRAAHSITLVDGGQLETWRNQQADKMTYLVDVRTVQEYEAGHPEGALHAPGGQLIQSTDKYLMLRNARVVVIDDDGLRASIAAGWLKRMGWKDVHVWPIQGESVLMGFGKEPKRIFRGSSVVSAPTISAGELAELQKRQGADVFDLDSSVEFERMHLPGSIFVERRNLSAVVAGLDGHRVAVLVSSDGAMAGVCASDLPVVENVRVLEGGKLAWQTSGHPVSIGTLTVPPDIDDVWRMPLEARGDRTQNIDNYLSWEIALTEQILTDRNVKFVLPEPH